MSQTAFALRAEYETAFVDASVAYGPNAHAFHLREALDQGHGKIVTDDPLLTAALVNLDGGNGPLLKTVAVGDSTIVAQIPTGAEPAVEPGAPTPVSAQPDVAAALAEPEPVQVPEQTPAEHADVQSEYETLPRSELESELDSRGVDFHSQATNAELVAALEADDNQER